MTLFFRCQSPEDVFDAGNGSDTVPPTVPGGLSASEITDKSVRVSWEPSGDNVAVKTYTLYQDKVEIVTDSITSYMVSDLLPQTIYTYTVTAKDGAGNISRTSPQIRATTLKKAAETESVQSDTIAPTAPKNLTFTNTTQTSTQLNWNAAADSVGVTAYRVYQDTLLLTSVPDTTYLVPNLTSGVGYNFSVSAIDAAENESVLSNVVELTTMAEDTVQLDTIVLPRPTNLMVSDSSQTSVGLVWDAVADSLGAVTYHVYQDSTIITTIAETQFEVTDLLAATEYTFYVSVSDAEENESDLSDPLTVTTENTDTTAEDTVPPTVPVNLVANQVTQTTANLSWAVSTDDSGVANYTVFQNGNAIATVSEPNYQVTGLSGGTSYIFMVSATDTAMNASEPSESVSIDTEVEPATIDKVLVFSKTAEFRHGSIEKGFATLLALGAANNFEVVQTEDSGDFYFSNLQQYQLVVFLNTTGDVLNATQQSAFENYIQAGGSYMGVHAATDTEYNWSWYGQLVGAYFDGHPDIQQATVNLVDKNHPSTSHLPNTWQRTDEWYNFRNFSPGIIPLLKLDENSYSGGTNGTDHPIAWYHEFDGGRSFYTGGGHADATYDEPDFRQHLLGGIEYCLGR